MARPRQYDSSEELELIGNQYFDSLGTKKPTVTGLVWHLGFESRQSFYDYEKNELFSYTIKRLRLRIEAEYEQKLHEPACTGAIFALKNFGWSDKQEYEHSGPNGQAIELEHKNVVEFRDYADNRNNSTVQSAIQAGIRN